MTAPELLVKLWSAGIELSVDGNQLRCRAPAGVLTPKVVAEMRRAKAELLPLVEDEQLAEFGFRRCQGCRRIQRVEHFEGLGNRCDECRGVPTARPAYPATKQLLAGAPSSAAGAQGWAADPHRKAGTRLAGDGAPLPLRGAGQPITLIRLIRFPYT